MQTNKQRTNKIMLEKQSNCEILLDILMAFMLKHRGNDMST